MQMMFRKPFLTSLLIGLLAGADLYANSADQFQQALKNSKGTVILTNGATAPATVQLSRTWEGDFCTTRIVNTGSTPVRVREVILAQAGKILAANTPFYAEGFQMLTQTSGTL